MTARVIAPRGVMTTALLLSVVLVLQCNETGVAVAEESLDYPPAGSVTGPERGRGTGAAGTGASP